MNSDSTTVELKVPALGESIAEVEVVEWLKQPGDPVSKDESVVVLETDKAAVEVPSPVAGRLAGILKAVGARVRIGEVLGQVAAAAAVQPGSTRPAGAPPTAGAPAAPEPVRSASPTGVSSPATPVRITPVAAKMLAEKELPLDAIQPSGPGGRVIKEDVLRAEAKARPAAAAVVNAGAPAASAPPAGDREEERVPMSLLRRRIAERLVQAQHTAALLTTFNEIDMASVIALRREVQEQFQERYQVKLGFMSFFTKAVIEALKEVPQLNAEIRGVEIVYRNYFDIGIAVGSDRGLVVPVLRHAERMSFAEIERAVADFALRAKERKLRPEDLEGGTFTITNGGVYGSLLSTPIVNPPQSGVLGMHAIQERPVAVNGQVVIRPMMYVALTYDHRIVDGREAVVFLRHVKTLIEEPPRMLIEI
ncbi:MAG: 2-oxoglutarate dehydrogenase complex dihydrolipoyllysine-residue succinyltransferase [Verrucomicrobia bacterium]|nr:2-oxoglutarate dehydrogenase complex dihydrolipoyllysine-residue succinyltransferase [Verrucomicrobiota bacterium]